MIKRNMMSQKNLLIKPIRWIYVQEAKQSQLIES